MSGVAAFLYTAYSMIYDWISRSIVISCSVNDNEEGTLLGFSNRSDFCSPLRVPCGNSLRVAFAVAEPPEGLLGIEQLARQTEEKARATLAFRSSDGRHRIRTWRGVRACHFYLVAESAPTQMAIHSI